MAISWVTIGKFSSETGYTEEAVRTKCKRQEWPKNYVWRKAPDGRILLSPEGYELWVVSAEQASAR